MQDSTRCERCGDALTPGRGRLARWCRPCAAIVHKDSNPQRRCPLWGAAKRGPKRSEWTRVAHPQPSDACRRRWCVACGVTLVDGGRNYHLKRTCSKACQQVCNRLGWSLTGDRTCRGCSKSFVTDVGRNHQYCSPECKPDPPRAHKYERVKPRVFTCDMVACHNLCASSHSEARYCSKSCSQVAKNARRRGTPEARAHLPHWLKSQPLQGPSLAECSVMCRPILGPTIDEWPMFGPTSAPSTMSCESCGVTFHGRRHRRFCSERCFRNPIDDDNPAACDVESGYCRRCDKLYVRPAYRMSSGCCSETCAKRLRKSNEKRRHRARKRKVAHEPYTLREIAERDGWRCHLCGGRVLDRPYTAHDKDPTIDHLIPQSHGGDDIRSNVALAHNRCNWERGNKGLAQLRLTG